MPPLIRRKAIPVVSKAASSNYARKRRAYKADLSSSARQSPVPEKDDKVTEAETVGASARPPVPDNETSDETVANAGGSAGASGESSREESHAKGWKRLRYHLDKHNMAKDKQSSPEGSPQVHPVKYDPDDYQHAKKQLKKAVLECYR